MYIHENSRTENINSAVKKVIKIQDRFCCCCCASHCKFEETAAVVRCGSHTSEIQEMHLVMNTLFCLN